MTKQHGAAEADVKIRPQGNHSWIRILAAGGVGLAFAVSALAQGRPWLALGWLVVSGCIVPLAMAARSVGVDLTPKFAVVHGLRGRRVPWLEVQEVVSHKNPDGKSGVWLILENGEPLKLRYPKTLYREGDSQYELELQRIEQWWLEHRGEAWQPVRTTPPPARG